jgi:hypothetical protein
MNHSRRRSVAAFAVLFALSAAGLYACAPEKKGPLEKAGEKIDEKVSDTKRAVEDAAD